MTWGVFAAEYAKQITNLARCLFRRWHVPIAVSVSDIEQEVWLGAWRAWEAFRPGRGGMSRAAFALCSGRLSAQRWIHSQRNALRRDGSAPSRLPAIEAELGRRDGDAFGIIVEGSTPVCGEPDPSVWQGRVIDPGQDAAVAFGEALRAALARCRNKRERRALVRAVQAGDVPAEWMAAT